MSYKFYQRMTQNQHILGCWCWMSVGFRHPLSYIGQFALKLFVRLFNRIKQEELASTPFISLSVDYFVK